jgi:hypothetical protein
LRGDLEGLPHAVHDVTRDVAVAEDRIVAGLEVEHQRAGHAEIELSLFAKTAGGVLIDPALTADVGQPLRCLRLNR